MEKVSHSVFNSDFIAAITSLSARQSKLKRINLIIWNQVDSNPHMQCYIDQSKFQLGLMVQWFDLQASV